MSPSLEIVRPATVLSQALEKLRAAIMIGEFKPGERLPESDLCRRMNISRTTLREALRSLEAEWLVDIVPNRGPSVARLNARDVEEIHEVWAVLTTEAFARFTTLARESDVAGMESALRRLIAGIKDADVLAQLDAIYDFFRVAFLRCDNRVWNEMIFRLLSRIHFLRAMSLKSEGSNTRCVKELRAIVAAVKAQDAESARDATRKHIDQACLAARRICLQDAAKNAAVSSRTKIATARSSKAS